jgi:hypothetical protein
MYLASGKFLAHMLISQPTHFVPEEERAEDVHPYPGFRLLVNGRDLVLLPSGQE